MVVLIRNIVDGCDTNAQGAIVRAILDSRFRDNNPIALDFSGIFNVTSSFVNTAFVDFIDDNGFDQFKKLVSLKNVNRQVGSMVMSRIKSVAAKSDLAAQ